MGAAHNVIPIEAATGSNPKAPGGKISMRFFNSRTAARFVVAVAAGVVFAVTGFRGSAGPAGADTTPADSGTVVVTSTTSTSGDNWPWG